MLQCRKTSRLTVSTIILLTLVVNSVTASPCGICGVDIICKSKYPVCSSNQVVTLDICGCCLVCKSILGKGETCSSTVETDFICKVGLECINGKCAKPK
ncbi:hypothetical protein GWI33_009552 [Rhynchophorus ferrugineus]|uniref:Uncharacterized protein n=1 Tax=Rhynchophorus ferrugineus TaxID=354439 RepID=A0A834IT58_RHYFE|nr:hypothetical protein GWI33_009552 [Rhynchophorus ferrugineus]